MSLHIEPLSSLPQLRGLLEVTRLVRDERDLTRLVDRSRRDDLGVSRAGARSRSTSTGPPKGDFEVTTVHGNEGAREALLGTTRTGRCVGAPPGRALFLRRGAYLIPHDEAVWGDLPSHIPDLPISLDPNAWHPEDALVVPMWGADGTLLGVVSVDEPQSGLRPSDEEIDVLVAFAEHVIAAFRGHAGRCGSRARPRIRFAACSTSLPRLPVDLRYGRRGARDRREGLEEALEFDKVAVCLAHGGDFSPSGTAGSEPDDPGLDFGLTDADLDLLLMPEFEIEGCYLIEDAVATALVGDCSTTISARRRRARAGGRTTGCSCR